MTPAEASAAPSLLLPGEGRGEVSPALSPNITRRVLLAAAAAPLLQPAASWQSTLSARVTALNGPGLLRSYDVEGTAAFDLTQANCAYTYDNAAVGLALLAAGDTASATRIADALAHAQANDRFFHDGRLRNAYRAGPTPATGPYPLSGWWDAAQNKWLEDGYQAGTATGVLAWAMLLWCAAGPAYRAPAQRAADFIAGTLKAPNGFAGGTIGFEPAPKPVAWISTEHNIDLAAAFAALGRKPEAAHAENFVASMWQPAQGRFAMGLKPDGTLNSASALDANLWPLLAPDPPCPWRAAYDWVLANHAVPRSALATGITGVDFNTDRDGIWLEGTAYLALASRRLGRQDLSTRLLSTLRTNTAPAGLIYATTTPTLATGLSTGLDTRDPDFLYFRRPHIAATAWAILAERDASPFMA